ncbi:DUF429 domain-containing protein [Mycolicibacterium thermoresistibile]
MRFVGLDLAWGNRNPSGIAVLTADGVLEHVGAAPDHQTVLRTVAPFTEGRCLVGIDAPLIVRNATGRRPAEAALSADFARFDAGAHPANTTLPVFAAGLPGARIAQELGLDVDPRSTSGRRAIEVYPHPATVALFRLGRTLKYKRRAHRSTADRRSELRKLMSLLEGLHTADPALHVGGHPGWLTLRRQVTAATKAAQLDRAEDPVDAVLCAYIALFAQHRPGDVVVYGDGDTGYIVTPRLPPDLVPSPRNRPS